MTSTILRWDRISYSVRCGFWLRKRQVLDGVSISLPSGSAFGLIGPNGAGKTTTIKIGAGLLQPDSGQVFKERREPLTLSDRKNIGFLTELQYFYPHVTVEEWLYFLGQLSGCPRQKLPTNIQHYSHVLELESHLKSQMKSLSKGQAQRVGLAQALVHEPEILLLDEPMSGLDPYWRHKVLRLLQDFKADGGSILFSTHILADIERLCDQIALIQDGRIRWQGPIGEVGNHIYGYEVVCTTVNSGRLDSWAAHGTIEYLPDGTISFSLSLDHKDSFLQFAIHQGIEVRALRPHTQKLETVLYGIGR